MDFLTRFNLIISLFLVKPACGKLRMYLKQVDLSTDPNILISNISVEYTRRNLFDFNLKIYTELMMDLPNIQVNDSFYSQIFLKNSLINLMF